MSRYQPSHMTKALGLEAYDFRNSHSDSDNDDDGTASGGADDASAANGDDSDGSTKFDEGSQEGGDDDDDDTDDGDNSCSRFRNSIETSAMDTVMTGDHVNALLKIYSEDDLPKRWSDTITEEDLQSTYENNVVPRVGTMKDKRREWGSSWMTTGESFNGLEEVGTDDDNDDTLEDHIGELHMKKNYAEVTVMSTKIHDGGLKAKDIRGEERSSFSSSHSNATDTMDNRTMNKLLWDHEEGDEESEVDADDIRAVYNRMSSLGAELKDNLTEKANQLGQMLTSPASNGANNNAQKPLDPPAEESGANSNVPTVSRYRRPILRLPNGGENNDNNEYTINEDTIPVIESVPTHFFNDGRRPRKSKRGTVTSDSTYNPRRRRSQDSQTSETSCNAVMGNQRRISVESQNSNDEENPELRPQHQKKERRDSWMSLDKVHEERRNSNPCILEIDDDGMPFDNEYQSSSGQFYRPGPKIRRCICVLIAVTVVALSSALIGLFALPKEEEEEDDKIKHDTYAPIYMGEDADSKTLEEAIEVMAVEGKYDEDHLHQMATSVDNHCHSDHLNTATGRWECQQICHDHFCCFEMDAEGDMDVYNCREDPSKLCMIFAPCEILVLDDDYWVNRTQPDPKGAKIGYGGIPHDGEEQINPQMTNADDMGWMEIRKKYVNAYCDESNLETKSGKKQCQNVCEHHFCCFDTSKDGYNCYDDPSMTCDIYSLCQNIMVGLFDDDDVDLPPKKPVLPELPLGPPGMMADKENLPPVPSLEDDQDAKQVLDASQYTDKELIMMEADAKERCSDYTDPTGRLHCERICKPYSCCFKEDGCQVWAPRMCEIYDICKVLNIDPSWYEGKKEEGADVMQVTLVDIENEVDDDDDHAYYDEVEPDPAQEVIVAIEDDGKDEAAEQGSNQDGQISTPAELPKTTPNPTPKPVPNPKPTSKPTKEPTPEPVVAPAPLAEEQLSTGSTAQESKKPPPPPPIRCIPEGDDEVHTEVYSDDWNDDRYDRCKRWEKKHGMTISEYWDMQGIDSTLEKNILENMLIMDNGKTKAAKENGKEGNIMETSDLQQPPGDNMEDDIPLDDLDDTILEEEDDAFEDDLFEDEEELIEEDNLLDKIPLESNIPLEPASKEEGDNSLEDLDDTIIKLDDGGNSFFGEEDLDDALALGEDLEEDEAHESNGLNPSF